VTWNNTSGWPQVIPGWRTPPPSITTTIGQSRWTPSR
jgi:hypothetical protein